jgi:hypothetical protein
MRMNRIWRGIVFWTWGVLLLCALAPEALAADPFPLQSSLGACHRAGADAHRGSAGATLANGKKGAVRRFVVGVTWGLSAWRGDTFPASAFFLLPPRKGRRVRQ